MVFRATAFGGASSLTLGATMFAIAQTMEGEGCLGTSVSALRLSRTALSFFEDLNLKFTLKQNHDVWIRKLHSDRAACSEYERVDSGIWGITTRSGEKITNLNHSDIRNIKKVKVNDGDHKGVDGYHITMSKTGTDWGFGITFMWFDTNKCVIVYELDEGKDLVPVGQDTILPTGPHNSAPPPEPAHQQQGSSPEKMIGLQEHDVAADREWFNTTFREKCAGSSWLPYKTERTPLPDWYQMKIASMTGSVDPKYFEFDPSRQYQVHLMKCPDITLVSFRLYSPRRMKYGQLCDEPTKAGLLRNRRLSDDGRYVCVERRGTKLPLLYEIHAEALRDTVAPPRPALGQPISISIA